MAGSASRAPALTFGAIGDSLTDEYQGSADQPALGWVEILAAARGLDFGPRSFREEERGEPRLTGFAHNWSRFGINVLPPSFAELNLFQEIPLLNPMPPLSSLVDGLAGDIRRGEVDVVYVGLGSVDFLIHLFNSGRFTGPGFQAFQDALVGEILGVVDTLVAAGNASIFVGGISPVIPPANAFHPPISPEVDEFEYASAVFLTNGRLEQEARRRGARFVNIFQNIQFRLAIDNTLGVGGEVIPFDSIGKLTELVLRGSGDYGPCATQGGLCASRKYALTFWLHDRVHPNTVPQGLMANDFLGALNLELGTAFSPLTDEEVLELALVPEPSGLPAALALLGGLGGLQRRARRSRAARTAAPTS